MRRLIAIDSGVPSMMIIPMLMLVISVWHEQASVLLGVTIGILLLGIFWFASGTFVMSMVMLSKKTYRWRYPRFDAVTEFAAIKVVTVNSNPQDVTSKSWLDVLKRPRFTHFWILFALE